jgi:hypothetical protein
MSAYTVTLKLWINLRIGKKTLRLERFGVAHLEHVEVGMDEVAVGSGVRTVEAELFCA